MPTTFSIKYVAAEQGSSKSSSQLHPADRIAATAKTATPSRVLELLDDHRPWEVVDNLALIIVDQTYAALLEILGPAASPSHDRHVVEVSRPVDPADPDSPLLSVNASATHCCTCLVNSAHGGAAPGYRIYTSTKQKGKPQYSLARTSVSVASGTLHVSCSSGSAGGGGWTCSDVRPNVSEKGLFGVLDAIVSRLDAAIQVEARLIEMARESGCCVRSPKMNDVIDARMLLEKMRGEVDLDAVMRRRRQKRQCREIQQIGCYRSDVGPVVDEAGALAKKLKRLCVSQKKRCPPAKAEEEDQLDLVNEADVLTKRLRAMHV